MLDVIFTHWKITFESEEAVGAGYGPVAHVDVIAETSPIVAIELLKKGKKDFRLIDIVRL